MGKRYGQLGIEERTMIQVQLEMRIKPAAIALGASTRSTSEEHEGQALPFACLKL